MRHSLSRIGISLILGLLVGCAPQPAQTEETAEPLLVTQSEATSADQEATDATATPTAAPILIPETPTPTDPRMVLTEVPQGGNLPGCVLAPQEQFEAVLGPLMGPPNTYFGPEYSDIATEPPDGWRVSFNCQAFAEQGIVDLMTWIAPSPEAALSDYQDVLKQIGDEAVPVKGIGEGALWWPRGLLLEAVHGDSRITVLLGVPSAHAADGAAALAASAVAALNPESGAVRAEPVNIPADAPAAEVARLPQDSVFDLCSLTTPEEIEAVIGPISAPSQSSTSVGESAGYFYDCSAGSDGVFLTMSLQFGENPSAMLLGFSEAPANDATATPVKGVGDKAWITHPDKLSAGLIVVRGNIHLFITISGTDHPDDYLSKVETFAQGVLDRLFERYSLMPLP